MAATAPRGHRLQPEWGRRVRGGNQAQGARWFRGRAIRSRRRPCMSRGAYPTWTLAFDDGVGGPGEPDFDDLVVTVTATRSRSSGEGIRRPGAAGIAGGACLHSVRPSSPVDLERPPRRGAPVEHGGPARARGTGAAAPRRDRSPAPDRPRCSRRRTDPPAPPLRPRPRAPRPYSRSRPAPRTPSPR